jgi:vacuolar protein sorting-associated protein 13A/C
MCKWARGGGAKVSSYPNSGGAKKVQIYTPFVFMNKTGLPFNLAARTWNGSQKQVAGQALFESESSRDDS